MTYKCRRCGKEATMRIHEWWHEYKRVGDDEFEDTKNWWRGVGEKLYCDECYGKEEPTKSNLTTEEDQAVIDAIEGYMTVLHENENFYGDVQAREERCKVLKNVMEKLGANIPEGACSFQKR